MPPQSFTPLSIRLHKRFELLRIGVTNASRFIFDFVAFEDNDLPGDETDEEVRIDSECHHLGINERHWYPIVVAHEMQTIVEVAKFLKTYVQTYA